MFYSYFLESVFACVGILKLNFKAFKRDSKSKSLPLTIISEFTVLSNLPILLSITLDVQHEESSSLLSSKSSLVVSLFTLIGGPLSGVIVYKKFNAELTDLLLTWRVCQEKVINAIFTLILSKFPSDMSPSIKSNTSFLFNMFKPTEQSTKRKNIETFFRRRLVSLLRSTN